MRIEIESMDGKQFEQYRDLCDSRSSAEFRFRRECCGIEIAEMAEDLGVRLDTAKRWENPNKGLPPSLRAWAHVDSAYLDLLDRVEAAVQAVENADLDVSAKLPYRRGVAVGRENAASRAVGIALAVLGYDFEAVWSR